MVMEIFTKGNELMIKQQDMVCICILMVRDMKGNELMINRMGRGRNDGRMGRVMKGIIKMGGNKAKAC